MAIRDVGNPAFGSTTAYPAANPSSGTLLAEVKNLQDVQYEVRYLVGADTLGIWRLQQCLSSGLGSTAVVDETVVFTGAGLSAEYVLNYDRLQSTSYSTNARFRIMLSTAFTGNYAAKVTAEPLT